MHSAYAQVFPALCITRRSSGDAGCAKDLENQQSSAPPPHGGTERAEGLCQTMPGLGTGIETMLPPSRFVTRVERSSTAVRGGVSSEPQGALAMDRQK